MNLLASLRYLVALHEHRHFGRAAQACHHHAGPVNALRAGKEFGVVVVRRGRSFEGFTPEGERVLATAQRMLHEHQVLQRDLSNDAAHPRGTLRPGTPCPRPCPSSRGLRRNCRRGTRASCRWRCR